MSKRLTVELPDDLARVIKVIARRTETADRFPTLTEEQVIRLLLRDAAERLVEGDLEVGGELEGVTGEQLAAAIPDHVRTRILRAQAVREGVER